ncbi:unnamed protein product [Hydatigera taeniaeformis]|uniref:Uncharacterized protein n=1 Tax=Hydatigena taeniaeformis TaxID=6205 RepID=A0A0R3X3K3_HYDTA|nr:unnamed protein product [Hydatigera taeniaeformis]
MELHAESGLKIAARILAREKPSIFEALFVDPVGSNFGPDIADFAFPKDAFSMKQKVIFNTILVHIFPSYVNGEKTEGLEGKCILIDTNSSFPILAFTLFTEKFLSTRYPATSHSALVDEVNEFLTHLPDLESICICTRMLLSAKVGFLFRKVPHSQDLRRNTLPFYYRPNQRVVFQDGDPQSRQITVEITDGDGPAFSSAFKLFTQV